MNNSVKVSYKGSSVRIANTNINSMISNSSKVIFTNNNFQRTIDRLHEIDNTDCEDNEDDWGATRPTRYAWQHGLEILHKIKKSMLSGFPLGFASLNCDGGIELIWKNHDIKNEIRLTIPSCNKINMSLYIRNYSNENSKLFAKPSVDLIVKALQFLYQ